MDSPRIVIQTEWPKRTELEISATIQNPFQVALDEVMRRGRAKVKIFTPTICDEGIAIDFVSNHEPGRILIINPRHEHKG